MTGRIILDGSTLSIAERTALLEVVGPHFDAGCDLLDADDVFIEDISPDFVAEGSSVGHGIYRPLHGTARLLVSRELQWGFQRVRPYMLVASAGPARDYLLSDSGEVLLTDDGATYFAGARLPVTWYRFNLGVFLLSTPQRDSASTPPLWSVDCYSKLKVLSTPYGSSYTIAAGANVVEAVEALIVEAGETKVNITPSSAVQLSVRSFSLGRSDNDDGSAQEWTALGICNALLNSIGYRALTDDEEGFFVSVPYQAPDQLGPMASYSADSPTTTVGEDRTAVADFFDAANVVIGINTDLGQDAIPVPDNGIATRSNAADGPTSIAGRGDTEYRRIISGSFASQDALVTAVESALNDEKRITTRVEIMVSPNPAHGHFDVVNYRDDQLSVNGRFLVTDWDLPLNGGDMRLSLREV